MHAAADPGKQNKPKTNCTAAKTDLRKASILRPPRGSRTERATVPAPDAVARVGPRKRPSRAREAERSDLPRSGRPSCARSRGSRVKESGRPAPKSNRRRIPPKGQPSPGPGVMKSQASNGRNARASCFCCSEEGHSPRHSIPRGRCILTGLSPGEGWGEGSLLQAIEPFKIRMNEQVRQGQFSSPQPGSRLANRDGTRDREGPRVHARYHRPGDDGGRHVPPL